MNITPQLINTLKERGYSEEQINKAMSELQQEEQRKVSLTNAYNQSMQKQNTASNVARVVSPWGTPEYENMNKYQLDVNGTLERLYHLFRSDILVIKEGQTIYVDNPVQKARKLNDTGLNDCMELLSTYLNKEIFLGNYDEERIFLIVYDISNAFKDLLYMNYERYGWVDTDDITGGQKRTYYRTLVLQVSNVILGAYMRAWKGEERRSLRESRQVMQNEQLNQGMPGININQNSNQRERGLLNPMRYIKGKVY